MKKCQSLSPLRSLTSLFLSLSQIILKQLVDAAKELQDKCIFHRDIKVENILIETSSDVPRVRLIDFGLSCFVKEASFYRVFYGKMSSFCSCSSLIYQSVTFTFNQSVSSSSPSYYYVCVLQEPLLTSLRSGTAVAPTGPAPPQCGSWEWSCLNRSIEKHHLRPTSSWEKS